MSAGPIGARGGTMETQIWSKAEEKWAYILVLKGQDLYRLKVTGNVLTLKRKYQSALEALQQGQSPEDVGAKSVEVLNARSIQKAQVSPGNSSLTVYGGEDGSKSLSYSTGDDNADAILKTILAQSGKSFTVSQEDVGVVEALLPPLIIGGLGGLGWGAVYQAAGTIAAGEEVEIKGARHRGIKRLLAWLGELLGTGGTIAVGVVLLALVLGWAVSRLVRRPQRSVWVPETV